MTHPQPNITVIGAGAWGTALARHLAVKDLPIRLWAYEQDVAESIQRRHENTRFLPGIPLPSSLKATSSLGEAVERAELILFAVPSHAARSVLMQLAPLLVHPIPLVNATKGIEEDTLKLMSEVIREALASHAHRPLAFL